MKQDCYRRRSISVILLINSATIDSTLCITKESAPALTNAKSLFRFDCQNDQCVRGDFDLSDELTSAVAGHRTSVTGEMCCQGWLDKNNVGTAHCNNILRYKFSLAY